MYKYQVEVTERIPDKLVKTFSKKLRKRLIEGDEGYHLNVVRFGRYEEFAPAMIVCDLLNALYERHCRYDYDVQVVEVEEWVGGILYDPRSFGAKEGNLESVKGHYA